VDVGQLRPLNRWLTRKICQRLDLLITRSMAARSRLLDLGVVREIHVTADLAFRFVDGLGVPTASNLRSVVGIVPIEFYQWPIRARLFGRRAHLHRWPYYRTWTAERAAASNRMVALYQRLVAHCIDHHDLDVLLIAMDELDVEVCGKIAEGLAARHAERVRRASSIELSPFEMAALLRSLGYLVTSRYHACVLSMASGVPQMAIAHDERLPAIYDELELNDFLLWYQAPGLAETALEKFDRMVKHADVLRAKLQDKHQKWFVPASQRNREQLACWASAQSR